MDQFLPREMLAQIAGHLSKKDFNSLARTSKTAKWKLDGYRKETRVELIFESIGRRFDDSRASFEDEHLQFEVHLKTEGGGVRCFKSELFNIWNQEAPTEEDERKREESVDHFYYRNRENPLDWHDAYTHFYFNDALKVHFNFLWNNNVKIDKLTVEDGSQEYERCILRSFPLTGMTVEELHLGNSFHVDFIIACNPKCLFLDITDGRYSNIGCDNFYQLPVIRQLRKLVIEESYFPVFSLLKEGDLPALSASHLELRTSADTTVQDVKTFLTQWMKSKRELEFLDLKIHFDVPEMQMVVSKLDRSFVSVEEVRAEEWTRILRRNDGQLLICKVEEVDPRYARGKTNMMTLKTV